jgi:hypothetical protein
LALIDGGSTLHAVLQDRDAAANGGAFNLTLRAYKGPVVRVVVDEFPAPPEADDKADKAAAAATKAAGEGEKPAENDAAENADADAPPPAPPSVLPPEARRRKPRYQLPDILEPGLETPSARAVWSAVSETKHTWTGTIEPADQDESPAVVRLTFDPFKVELFVGSPSAADGSQPTTTTTTDVLPSAVLNARAMFHVERTRRDGKKEGDAEGLWEESFNGHSDSKPRGPQAISLDLAFPGAAHAYGLPERATSLALRATAETSPLNKPAAGSAYSEPYRLYNLDVFEYLDDSPFGLYGSIPYLVAHRAEKSVAAAKNGGASSSSSSRPSTTVGAAWINAAEQYVDLFSAKEGTAVQWIAESGVLDLFLLAGPSPERVSRQLASVAGTTAMPQYFSLGYHQCRWNYKDEDDVAAVDSGFDEHSIPYDVLWLDIEHTDGKRWVGGRWARRRPPRGARRRRASENSTRRPHPPTKPPTPTTKQQKTTTQNPPKKPQLHDVGLFAFPHPGAHAARRRLKGGAQDGDDRRPARQARPQLPGAQGGHRPGVLCAQQPGRRV